MPDIDEMLFLVLAIFAGK